MNYLKTNACPRSGDSNRSHVALFACGLWLRIGAVGAFGLMGVLHQLFNGEMQPLSALALAAAFGALMVLSWSRAQVALDRDDEATLAKAPASLPAKLVVSGSLA